MAKKNEMVMVKVLRVSSRSPKGSFRRAGYGFGPEATDIPLAKLSKAQIKAIKGESMLVSMESEIEMAAEAVAEG